MLRHTPYKHTKEDLLATLASLFIVTVAVLFGFAAGLLVTEIREPAAPYCPTEDSCVVDYHDGAWHVKEVTP